MKLVTLDEVKEKLSIDFDYKDREITNLTNAAEGYLFLATGIDFSLYQCSEDAMSANAYSVAKEWVLLKSYMDYYNSHTEIDNLRLTNYMKQLQTVATVM